VIVFYFKGQFISLQINYHNGGGDTDFRKFSFMFIGELIEEEVHVDVRIA
jgi:hypothetical protein